MLLTPASSCSSSSSSSSSLNYYHIIIAATALTCLLPASVHSHGTNRNQVSPGATTCVFTPVNNASLVRQVYPYFDRDSSVRIVEYQVRLAGNGTDGWEDKFDQEAFQPWRWYRTQGVGSSRLLLLNYYYYGLLKRFSDTDSVKVSLTLQVSPASCVASLARGDLDVLLSDYLLRDFDINENAVKHPFKYDEDVEVCSMYIDDVDGWGYLSYQCCGYDDDRRVDCHDVYEDGWVTAFRLFILVLTIIIFLHFPSLIPKAYRKYSYVFEPPQDLTFNLRLTNHPELFSDIPTTTVLNPREWQQLEKFKNSVSQLQPEVTYTAHVQSAHFRVSRDRLLTRYSAPVNFSRSLFDFLIRCKVRHSGPIESCCRTSICGQQDLNCPPWHSWLRGLRTILVMGVLALPSVPLLYAISAEGLGYQQLADEMEARGLAKTHNFFPGHTFGRVVTGLLAFMYVLNTIILLIDGATDSSLTKMYTTVLDVSEKKSAIRDHLARGKSVMKRAFFPIKKYGIVILPLWLILMALVPLYGLLLYIVHTPLMKVLIHAIKGLSQRCHLIDRDKGREEKFLKFCEMFWFLISLVFVFIVFTLGINLLIHVVALAIVKIFVDEDFIYRIQPVVLILLFYLRDSFKSVISKYAEYQRVIIETLKTKNEGELRKKALDIWYKGQNQMLVVNPSELLDDTIGHQSGPDVGMSRDVRENRMSIDRTTVVPMESLEASEYTSMFVVTYGHVRMRLPKVLLFLNNRETLLMSKKFLFHTCTMECPGAPGSLEANFVSASIKFLKIATFLIFVMLVVMAYGNAYYISPANHVFITLVSGLLPLLLRNVCSKKDSNATLATSSNIRFETQFNKKIDTFHESWDLEDILLDDVDFEAVPDQVVSLTDFRPEANKQRSGTVPNTQVIDLVLDISSPAKEEEKEQQRGKEATSGCLGCCRGNDAEDNTARRNSTREEETELAVRERRLSIWNFWTDSSKSSSNVGMWREKPEKAIYIGAEGHANTSHTADTSAPPHSSKAPGSNPSGDASAASRTGTNYLTPESSLRPVRSSSEFRRYSPFSTPKTSVSSMADSRQTKD